jgi:RNA polymerase sigma-70 factor (ECF subfamily)
MVMVVTGDGPDFMKTRALVDLAQEGDRAALNDLLTRYLPRVLRVVRLKRGPFLGQKLEDQDLAQEVLIRVWRSLEGYDPSETASFLLWVTRVAENALRDLARRQLAAKRNPGYMFSLDAERERGVPEEALHPMSTATPSRVIGQVEDSQIVDSAVACLDSSTQELIVLRYYFDLPLEEIAQPLELGTEALRSRIRRSLAKLRKELEFRGVDGAARPAEVLRRSF